MHCTVVAKADPDRYRVTAQDTTIHNARQPEATAALVVAPRWESPGTNRSVLPWAAVTAQAKLVTSKPALSTVCGAVER